MADRWTNPSFCGVEIDDIALHDHRQRRTRILTAEVAKIDHSSSEQGAFSFMARLILALAYLIAAAEGLFSSPTAAAAERTALVIGNATYDELGVLPNASADAKAIAVALQELGYETQLVIDAGDARLRKEVRKFALVRTMQKSP